METAKPVRNTTAKTARVQTAAKTAEQKSRRTSTEPNKMILEWMGRNRKLIRLLMKYINLFTRFDKKIQSDSGVSLNAQQWQTLECIIEYEDENRNMFFMANQIGVPKSTFSKNVKLLVDFGLADRYQQSDNRKDIILKPSDKGREYYKNHSAILYEQGWKTPFAILEKLSDENILIFEEFMSKMIATLEPEVRKLFKIQ
jgi:DNA-binding MarR family transcriptional regulator